MSKVAIMITSCDVYQECWKPIIVSLDKFWPDREYPRYIVTNYKEENLPNTTFIKVGDDNRSWCNLTRMGMEAIPEEYVIYLQDDYWLNQKVDNEAIKTHVDYFEKNSLDFLKIYDDMPRDKYRIGDGDYCENPPDIRYSINTAIAIWRKSTISKLMIQDWSGWKFERKIISYINEHHIKLKSQTLHSSEEKKKGINTIKDNAIVRGVWTHAAVDFLKENDLNDVLKLRKLMGPITTWLYDQSPSPQSMLRYPFWGALKILKMLKVNW